MRTDDFNYVLPEEMIAQTPLQDRTASKMMVLNKENGELIHSRFYHLIEYLKPGDVLVFNNTRVLPARLYGIKEGGTAHIEVLLLKRRNLDEWEVLMKPAKRIKLNGKIIFGNGELTAEVIEELDDGGRIVRFSYDGVFETILEKLGNMPLPPTSKKNWRTKTVTKPFMQNLTVLRQHPRQDCISPRSISNGWRKKELLPAMSPSMLGLAPSARSALMM